MSVWLLLAALASPALGCIAATQTVAYDSYNNTVLTPEQVALREKQGNTFWCVNNFVQPCSASEGRRIDGSCNNLAAPYAGAGHARFDRILPAVFDSTGKEPRLGSDGKPLPGARYVRTRALSTGRVEGEEFTQLMMLFFVFAATDIAAMSILDTLNYCVVHPTCCAAAGAPVSDPMCYPIPVPADDPVHRFSGVRCLNMTRPISFQSEGCIDSTIVPPERINYGTPFFDLSNMYGNDPATSVRQRLFKGGLLNFTTTAEGKQWPQYIAPAVNRRDGIQGLTGVNFFFGLWFWREHNRIAASLAALNPCWDDERLFTVARDINIAQYDQIFYYEMLPPLMGYHNLVFDGIISDDAGFRDVYDAKILPGEYIESLHTMRWIHLIQEGLLGLYDATGKKLSEFPETNLTLSTSLLNANENFKYYTQGSFRTNTGAFDRIIDPYVAELGLATLQRVTDLTSSDVTKSRLLGIAPYVKFLEYCDANGGKPQYKDFDDIVDYVNPSGRKLLSEVYASVQDVDLIVALWLEQYKAESLMPHTFFLSSGLAVIGRKLLSEVYASVQDVDLIVALWLEQYQAESLVPRTFYCLVRDQLIRSVRSDRHWYERKDRPNAFTAAQLATVRKASVARVLCDSGDTVATSGISAKPFLVISESNPIVSCSTIDSMDLSLWKDPTCSKSG